MIVIKIILCLLILILTGFGTGNLFFTVFKIKRKTCVCLIGLGSVLNVTLFCAAAWAAGLAGLSLNLTGIIFTALLILLQVISVIDCCRGRSFREFGLNKSKQGMFSRVRRVGRVNVIFIAVVLLLFILQAVLVTCFMYDRPNVTRSIYIATRAFDLNKCFTEAPIMMLWAFLGKIFFMHPLEIIYTLLPLPALFVFYIVFYAVCEMLFEDECELPERLFMVFCFCLFNLFGYQSEGLIAYTMLFGWFTGRAFVFYAVLPCVFLVAGSKLKEGRTNHEKTELNDLNLTNTDSNLAEQVLKSGNNDCTEERDYYEWEELDMKNHKIINARTVAIGLLAVVIILLLSVYILNNKINSLYEATVNLENKVDEGVRTKEIKDEDGNSIGFVMIDAEGSISVIGGGATENGELLYDLISEYGNRVLAWYLFSDEEKDCGAMNYCKEQKAVEVLKVYVMNVESETNMETDIGMESNTSEEGNRN